MHLSLSFNTYSIENVNSASCDGCHPLSTIGFITLNRCGLDYNRSFSSISKVGLCVCDSNTFYANSTCLNIFCCW